MLATFGAEAVEAQSDGFISAILAEGTPLLRSRSRMMAYAESAGESSAVQSFVAYCLGLLDEAHAP